MPAVSLFLERGILDNVGPGTVGIGGIVAYKRASYDYNSVLGNGRSASWTDIVVGVRGTYHYNFGTNPKIDTYAGLTLGVRVSSYKNDYLQDAGIPYKSSSVYGASGFFLGGRYFFTDNIGAFGEIGYDISYLKVGLSAKF